MKQRLVKDASGKTWLEPEQKVKVGEIEVDNRSVAPKFYALKHKVDAHYLRTPQGLIIWGPKQIIVSYFDAMQPTSKDIWEMVEVQ